MRSLQEPESRIKRYYVRWRKINVQKKLKVVQARRCNLALVLRQLLGAGTPRGLQDRIAELFLLVLEDHCRKNGPPRSPHDPILARRSNSRLALHLRRLKKRPAKRPV